MKNKMEHYLYGDNIWIEGKRGWFSSAKIPAVFELDMENNICCLFKELPEKQEGLLRQNSICIKAEEKFFLLPVEGTVIWVYCPEKDEFNKIEFQNPKQKKPFMDYLFDKDGILYIWASGLRQIVTIDIDKQIILAYYDVEIEEEKLGQWTVVNNKLYIVSIEKAVVYEYDFNTNCLKEFFLSNTEVRINTICHDGENFWLGSISGCIYIWKPEAEILEKVYSEKSTNYEVAAFSYSIYVNGKILFVPFEMNSILLFDRKNKKSCRPQMPEEGLSEKDGGIKLSFRYVRDNRYCGYYSWLTRRYMEIDTETQAQYYIDYKRTPEVMYMIHKCLKRPAVWNENDNQKELYNWLLSSEKNICSEENTEESNGLKIHNMM